MKLITSNLVEELTSLCADATHISWVTAFAMKSGAELIVPTLQDTQARGAVIQILVGELLKYYTARCAHAACRGVARCRSTDVQDIWAFVSSKGVFISV